MDIDNYHSPQSSLNILTKTFFILRIIKEKDGRPIRAVEHRADRKEITDFGRGVAI